MEGTFSIDPQETGECIIVFSVADKCAVDMLTLDLMRECIDVLYEPKDRDGRYESCLLCNEKTWIKIRTI